MKKLCYNKRAPLKDAFCVLDGMFSRRLLRRTKEKMK